MTDIFEHLILCNKCEKKMSFFQTQKNGFVIRGMQCENCGEKVFHPGDLKEHEQFQHLKNKQFHVKLRIIGNSYAVSIPKEIISFMNEQEKKMKDIVRLCFEDANKLSLLFEQ